MKLNVRNLVESDYDLLVQWWKDWGWSPVSKDMLPDNGLGGIMIQSEKTPIIAGFIYWTNSDAVWLEWVVSDKKANRITRAKALMTIIDVVEEMARAEGKKYLVTFSDNKSFISTLKKKSWYVDDEPIKKIIKKI
tara:strand:- start:208 stop:612 length:405 start_codon:yes stop_codon:yes gene_type:complete